MVRDASLQISRQLNHILHRVFIVFTKCNTTLQTVVLSNERPVPVTKKAKHNIVNTQYIV
jgi:hypothetical protein